MVRSSSLALLAGVVVGGCGDSPRATGDPRPLEGTQEHQLARAHTRFVAAIPERDKTVICPMLEQSLVDRFGCAVPGRLRLPPAIARFRGPLSEYSAAIDPVVPDVVQISARSLRHGGQSLILFFHRGPSGAYRIRRVLLGGYG